MNNRIKVFKAGYPHAVVGEATCEVGQRVRFHARSGGSADEHADLSNSDYLEVTAVSNDVVTAVSNTSGLTFKEYAHNTYVPDNDAVLVTGGAYPTRATHFPFS